MKFLKVLLAALLLITSLAFAKPSLADPPKYLSNPDYIEITKNLDSLKAAQTSQTQLETYTPEQLQKKIDALEFQKYALLVYSQCRAISIR